jgi:putative ABC transport system permease protein
VRTYIIPYRYLAGRKLRTSLTTLAVVFGVAVVLSVNMLLPMITAALNASELGVTGQVDMTVSSATGAPFSETILDKIAQTDGVAAAAPAFQRQVILPGDSNTPQFDLIGLDPTRAETVRFYQVSSGRFLNADDTDSALVSQGLAQALNLHTGDKLSVPTPNGLIHLTVAGVFTPHAGEQVLVPLQTAQRMYDAGRQITTVDMIIAAGANSEAVQKALLDNLGSAFIVGSAAANTAFAQSMKLGAIIFNIVGILTLFMGAFLIFNTFRTLVVERRRDIGMLRAVGATRGTITRLILVESALQGVIGTAIGLVLGYLLGVGMATALDGMLDRFVRIRLGAPVVPPEAVILAVVLGVGMTVLAGLLPALSAGRMPVLVALRGEQMEAVRKRATIGSIIGAGIVVIGAVLLVVGNAGMATFGGVLILTGLVMLGALLLHPIARGLDPVIRWLFAREGVLAEGNLERNPGRSSITMSALMIALALIVALWAVFSSIQDSYTRNLQRTLSADILLLPPSLGVWTGVVGVTDEFVQQLAQVPGVGDITGVSYAPVLVDGTSVQMMGIDPVTYPKVSSVLFTDGDDGTYAKLADGRTAILSGILASSLGAKVGDTVSVQTPQGTQPYHVVGIGADFTSMKIAAMYISKQNMAGDFANPDDIMLMANLAAEADGAAVRANIETLLKDYPQLTLYWGADFRAQTAQELEQLFSAFYFILLALAIPSVLGLINTLAINVLERTREIGVLRAIGATRGQIRRLVVAESLLLAMVGTALGLLAGVALGYALVSYIGASVYATNYYFPFVGILLTIALGFVLALLASVLPARQAARVKIVQALQYE